MNPYWDAGASGIMVGWRGIHQGPHFYRAILEGIAFELRLHIEGVEAALGQPLNRLIAVGGGARSPLWCQIIADICGRPVLRAGTSEATALGAGILAAAGAGLYPDVLTAARAMANVSCQTFPTDSMRRTFYEQIYQQVYRHLFPALQHYLDTLADLIGS
jgi:xylulokinase